MAHRIQHRRSDPKNRHSTQENCCSPVHKIEDTTVEHFIVEVIPEQKSQQSLYVTNVYSLPRDQLSDYDYFIRELRKRTQVTG